VRCDIAYGGAFYAYVDAESLGLRLVPGQVSRLIETGMRIKRHLTATYSLNHPDGDADLEFFYGTIFTQPLDGPHHSRNVCIFAEGEVDRSPTGTGVSARAAIHRARGELGVGEEMVIESIIGSRFTVRVLEETEYGPFPAVIPEVEGSASITGRNEFLIDPDDPLRDGFILR
jgi:trans-L-3-hydroxyproline dehydratase